MSDKCGIFYIYEISLMFSVISVWTYVVVRQNSKPRAKKNPMCTGCN